MKQLLIIAMLLVLSGCGGGEATITDPDMGDVVPDSGTADMSTANNGTTEDGGQPVDMGTDAADPVEYEHFLYVAELDGDLHVYGLENPGQPSSLGTTSAGGRVTFGAFHPTLERFYVTNETRVEGFDISANIPADVGSGEAGIGGTHLDITKDGNAAIVASYGGDSVGVIPLQDGVPQDSSQTLGGDGQPLCDRAHQARVHPSNAFVYVPCLGSDHVAIFGWDGAALSELPPAETAAGMGPRHLDFHPSLDVAYVLGESNSTVEVFDIDTASGALTRRQTVSTMTNQTGSSASSDIHVSPDGRFLYAMNRQPIHDIALFEIDQTTGELTWIENVDSGGEHSRSFAIHPDGDVLYVGNSDTNNVTIFDVADDGRLTLRANTLDFDARVWFVGVHSRAIE